MRLAVAVTVVAAVLSTACATRDTGSGASAQIRTRAPVNYQATVNNYLDLSMMLPADRRLAIGAPEPSNCALHAPGGAHMGWVVPVVHDTSPQQPLRASAASAASINVSNPVKGKASGPASTKVSASGTSADRRSDVSLDDVKVTGTRYFFWFSSETLAGVTRRADLCP